MGDFRWLESMSVGVDEFDSDHKRCIALLDEIRTALGEGRLSEARETSQALLHLVEDHVCREEAFLQRLGYPNTETVINAQKDSMARIKAVSEMIVERPQDAGVFVTTMQNAVIAYLLRADINFKSFVQAVGLARLAKE